MLKSMTGFGHFEHSVDMKDITVEIKSVNNRYTDFNIKVPKYYGFLEEKVRNFINGYISRGKIDIYISISDRVEDDKLVCLNSSLAKSYIDAVKSLKTTFDLEGDISVSTITRFTDIFDVERKKVDEGALWETVKTALEKAITGFTQMREREGERLYNDISTRANLILGIILDIEKMAPQLVIDYKQKLSDKISEMLGNTNIDEGRLLTEVAIFADKTAIDEEIVRLKSHFEEMKLLLNGNGAVGRKLDFLIQEINRETNTIGSKVSDISISKNVIEIKSEIEKLREQIQNIE